MEVEEEQLQNKICVSDLELKCIHFLLIMLLLLTIILCSNILITFNISFVLIFIHVNMEL